MTYPEVISYLESFINYESLPVYPYKEFLRLGRIKAFLSQIGNPERQLRCIHIAGSKGKGSTCAFITYILRQAGYRVGLYTSPHLSDFRERIRILLPVSDKPGNGAICDFEGMISKGSLTDLVTRLKPAIDRYNKGSRYGALSFFEVYTACAFLYFQEKKIDFAVLETGMGGRFDATNVVNSLVCAITPISFEHTQILGHTLREIAIEKAGIIKSVPGLIVITAAQEREVIKVLRDRCAKVRARLYALGSDITYQKRRGGFSVGGSFGKFSNLRLSLQGGHQLINAATAVACVGALRLSGVKVDIDAIRKGLYNTLWPGRCEVVARNPLVVLDGAQNAASAGVLKDAIKRSFQYRRLVLILGISSDKDIKGICSQLIPVSSRVVLTQSRNPRAANTGFIEGVIRKNLFAGRREIFRTKNVKEALGLAREKSGSQDLILITGSLFVVGEARSEIKGV